MATEWITEEGAFAELAEEWDALLPGDSTPFDLHCWYLSWWRAFGGSAELAICTVRRERELVAAFPLMRSNGRLLALANSHASVFRPLARDDEAMDELLASALAAQGSRAMSLIGLPAGDPCLAALRSQARRARAIPLVEAAYASPIVATDGDFDAWREASKPRWGAPLERFRRKMGRDYDAELSIVEPPRDLEAELEDGFRVEASGWKGRAGTAIASTPETSAFYWEVGREFADRGALRLSRIVLDGRTAAFDFCILHGNRLYLLKTGFDEEFRRLAPGLVMRLSIVEHCFEQGLDAHELLGSESEWKNKFATTKREHASFDAYSRRPLGASRYAYRAVLRPLLKHAYRRLRPRAR
jgi:CelD/BcsL family acetyltransferase involved in cellulose biosynthesis